jgi:hypothetical protein
VKLQIAVRRWGDERREDESEQLVLFLWTEGSLYTVLLAVVRRWQGELIDCLRGRGSNVMK